PRCLFVMGLSGEEHGESWGSGGVEGSGGKGAGGKTGYLGEHWLLFERGR
nr:hypothetical protein [Tanacetum cinerariifolium]